MIRFFPHFIATSATSTSHESVIPVSLISVDSHHLTDSQIYILRPKNPQLGHGGFWPITAHTGLRHRSQNHKGPLRRSRIHCPQRLHPATRYWVGSPKTKHEGTHGNVIFLDTMQLLPSGNLTYCSYGKIHHF